MPLGKPEDCPKYSDCRAPVCPLDACCLHTHHVQGEPVCFYMLEFVKDGAVRRFLALHEGHKWVSLLSRVVPEVKKVYPDVARKLERAEKLSAKLGIKRGWAA
jgi:hypothetical protein